MSASAVKLLPRVIGWQAAFSLGTALALAFVSPFLLLLSGEIAVQSSIAIAAAILMGGAFAATYSVWLLRKRRYVLRTLALGSRLRHPWQLAKLNDDPWRVMYAWLGSTLAWVVLFVVVMRPPILAQTTAITLSLLGAAITSTAALPLLVLVRSAFVRVIELAPPEVMGSIIDNAAAEGRLRGRVSRRLIAALSMPVLFLSIGSALIANAHLREADERDREETARVLARAALESPARGIEEGGLQEALRESKALGFHAKLRSERDNYRVVRRPKGEVAVVTPLDSGSAEVQFSGSTVSVLSPEPLVIALVATVMAGLLGAFLGSSLSRDLRVANRGVQTLGTDAALEGTKVMKPARFLAVAELGRAIELLAQRFRLFAHAQERAIDARQGATRMRGMFFASVSHDLKSPLNAILGFAELARRSENLTPGQIESLDLIVRRGRELLALIETILDAARVEAGQLTLVHAQEDINELLQHAVSKGKDLSPDHEAVVITEIAEGIPKLNVDRVRLGQALATFVGHALRTAERPSLRVRVTIDKPPARPTLEKRRVRIDIEVPSTRFSAQQLIAMMNPDQQPGEHRGLALGLRLAQSIVQLHGGKVRVAGRTVREPAFLVELPT